MKSSPIVYAWPGIMFQGIPEKTHSLQHTKCLHGRSMVWSSLPLWHFSMWQIQWSRCKNFDQLHPSILMQINLKTNSQKGLSLRKTSGISNCSADILKHTFCLTFSCLKSYCHPATSLLLTHWHLPMIWMISASRTPSAISCCKSLISLLWPDFAR